MDVVVPEAGFVEGPVWFADALWYTDIDGSTVSRVVPGEAPTVEYHTGGGPNGMTLGPGGALFVANNGGVLHELESQPSGIQRLVDGRVETLVTHAGETKLRACNDLCFGPDGRLYFTDPANPRPPLTYPCHVAVLDLETMEAEILHTGFQYTNGIAFHPDGDRLLVAESYEFKMWSFPWSADGIGEPELYCELPRDRRASPDGFCFDVEGNLYIAGTLSGKVFVFDADGKQIEELPVGGQDESMPTNCAFGGADNTTLFVTEAGTWLHPPHEFAHRQRVLSYDLGIEGLPLFIGE